MTSLSLRACMALALSLLIGYAAAQDPDLSPYIRSISQQGADILLNDNWRIPDGDLTQWQNPEFEQSFSSPAHQCTVPKIDTGLRGYTKYFPLSCKDGISWFTSRAYCAEGLRELAALFRYHHGTGKLQQFDWVPHCSQPVALIEHDNTIWIGTAQPIEKYRDIPGAGVLRVSVSGDLVNIEQSLTDFTVTAMALIDDNLWVTAHEGIARKNLSQSAWQKRYFDYGVNQADQLIITLSGQAPSYSHVARAEYLNVFPIHDKKHFLKVFAEHDPDTAVYWQNTMPEQLMPWILEAATHYEQGDPWLAENYKRERIDALLSDIERHADLFPNEVKSLLATLSSQRLSPQNQQAVTAMSERLGLADQYTQWQNVDISEYIDSYQRKEASTNAAEQAEDLGKEMPEQIPELESFTSQVNVETTIAPNCTAPTYSAPNESGIIVGVGVCSEVFSFPPSEDLSRRIGCAEYATDEISRERICVYHKLLEGEF